jgi:hypothetical protein
MKTVEPSGELVYCDEDSLVHHQGDKVLITHVDDLEPVFAQNQQRALDPGNGFSRGRTMRFLGSVPLSTLLARPELADPNELKKYLRAHPRLRAVNGQSF